MLPEFKRNTNVGVLVGLLLQGGGRGVFDVDFQGIGVIIMLIGAKVLALSLCL